MGNWLCQDEKYWLNETKHWNKYLLKTHKFVSCNWQQCHTFSPTHFLSNLIHMIIHFLISEQPHSSHKNTKLSLLHGDYTRELSRLIVFALSCVALHCQLVQKDKGKTVCVCRHNTPGMSTAHQTKAIKLQTYYLITVWDWDFYQFAMYWRKFKGTLLNYTLG